MSNSIRSNSIEMTGENKTGRELHDLSYLSLFSSFMSCMNYVENLKQTSNDDIMAEMRHQNTDYMEKLMKQNEQIIQMLAKLIDSKGVD